MTKYVALLRGINVGGVKKFPKTDQISMLHSLGFDNGKVYLHTGNWLLESTLSAMEVSSKISEMIKQTYLWNVPVLVLSLTEFMDIYNACPFKEDAAKKSYFMLLKKEPTTENKARANNLSAPNEAFHIAKRCVYYYCATGYGKAKLNGNIFEKKLDVAVTSRNYNTMTKVIALATYNQ